MFLPAFAWRRGGRAFRGKLRAHRSGQARLVAAEISDKLKSLLTIAGKVQKGGKHVAPEDVGRARRHGATDKEIHDTVLIAAAFCMFNRYVDGLELAAKDTAEPHSKELARLAENIIQCINSQDTVHRDLWLGSPSRPILASDFSIGFGEVAQLGPYIDRAAAAEMLPLRRGQEVQRLGGETNRIPCQSWNGKLTTGRC